MQKGCQEWVILDYLLKCLYIGVIGVYGLRSHFIEV